MKLKQIERVPHDVWQLIAKRLSQKDRSSARAVSRFFFNKMTPEWDRYSREYRKIRAIAAGGSHSLLLTETGELFRCGHNYYGQLGLGHTQTQATWVKLNPFPKSYTLSFDELCHQRHLAFLPVSIKTVLKQFKGLYQQLPLAAYKEKHIALFSATKSSIQQQLTEPLPAPWHQEFEQLSLTEFRAFYQRLRAHCKLAPAEIRSSSKCLVM